MYVKPRDETCHTIFKTYDSLESYKPYKALGPRYTKIYYLIEAY